MMPFSEGLKTEASLPTIGVYEEGTIRNISQKDAKGTLELRNSGSKTCTRV
jgi:hypothetical protein